MAKRLKKVVIPKEPQKGGFTPPTAPAVPQPAVFGTPPEPSAFAKRLDAVRERIRAKLAADKAAFGPPKPLPMNPGELLSTTVIEGKAVSEWSQEMDDFIESQKGIADMTDFPGWSVWAVDQWRMRGKPTPSTKVLGEITKLRDEAEDLVKFSAMDKDKSEKLPDKKAKKLLEAAQKKSDKAAELFAKANELAREHKKK